MDQPIHNTLFSRLCNVTNQTVLFRESDVKVFLTVTFNGIVFLINILITVSSFTLSGDTFTIIIDQIKFHLVKIINKTCYSKLHMVTSEMKGLWNKIDVIFECILNIVNYGMDWCIY